MFKRSAMFLGRGPFNHTSTELKNPKQIIIAKSLATEILEHNMIQTTTAKAKFINSHFYKFVDKVIKYKESTGNTELQKKYENEAKALLSGKLQDNSKNNEIFSKALSLANKWKSRIGENNIKKTEFLKLSHLEPAYHDAHPVTFIELRDLPLFVDNSTTPTYGNLTLWMALESLLSDSSYTKFSENQVFATLIEYLKNSTPEEVDHFFNVDLKKAREIIHKKKFEEQKLANKKIIIEDELDKPQIEEFKYKEVEDEDYYSSIKRKYHLRKNAAIRKEMQRMNHSIEHLGDVNLEARPHGVKVLKNCEY
ncbi:hypothetical protein ACO0R3_002137 [Hanseniaspora guilliermondii]